MCGGRGVCTFECFDWIKKQEHIDPQCVSLHVCTSVMTLMHGSLSCLHTINL